MPYIDIDFYILEGVNASRLALQEKSGNLERQFKYQYT